MSVHSSRMRNDEYLLTMAREWYGYGWWEAPFWFIGPEPGRPEKEDSLKKRCEAWIKLGERIKVIQRRIDEYRPKLVVMYGLSQARHFREIAGYALVPGDPSKIGSTCFVHTPAPTCHGLKKEYWLQLADKLRQRHCLESS
jgi:hypothetical protein